MTSPRYQNKYRIPSARAVWHDYNGGAYFITVCTKNREHSFGEIVRGGKCRDGARTVSTMDEPRTVSTMDEPRTVSTMDEPRTVSTMDEPRTVSTDEPQMQLSKIGQCLFDNSRNVAAHYPYAEIPSFVIMPNHWHAIVFIDGNIAIGRDGERPVSTGERWKNTVVNEKLQQISLHKKSLSVAIGGIKSAVTKFAHENNIEFAWQTRFHDRIIRDQKMMNMIADYIENNVARWDTDCFNELNETCRDGARTVETVCAPSLAHTVSTETNNNQIQPL